jgi:hypothetical protein
VLGEVVSLLPLAVPAHVGHVRLVDLRGDLRGLVGALLLLELERARAGEHVRRAGGPAVSGDRAIPVFGRRPIVEVQEVEDVVAPLQRRLAHRNARFAAGTGAGARSAVASRSTRAGPNDDGW